MAAKRTSKGGAKSTRARAGAAKRPRKAPEGAGGAERPAASAPEAPEAQAEGASPPPNPRPVAFEVIGGPAPVEIAEPTGQPERPPGATRGRAPVVERLRELMGALPDALDAGALLVVEEAGQEIERLQQEHERQIGEKRKVARLWKAEHEELEATRGALELAQQTIEKMRAVMERSQTPIIDGLMSAAMSAAEHAIREAGQELKREFAAALSGEPDED